MSTKKILIIYTGGTIGMARSDRGYIPQSGYFEMLLNQMPELKLPEMPDYEILVFEPLLDSSNIGPRDWNRILHTIELYYEQYDGFIVLHGTDTMSYTASAISFMIEGLDKNIIFTGSQIPLCEVRNDAREHIITSLLICANYNLKEVSLYFKNKLLRACRSSKINANSFNAFFSPNTPPLLTVGIRFDILSNTNKADIALKNEIFSATAFKRPVVFRKIKNPEPLIGVIRLFPGISEQNLAMILNTDFDGLIIEAYGAGNGPVDAIDFKAFFEALKLKNTISLLVSQCLRGGVTAGAYGTSLAHFDVASGYDMTFEAALAKMYYVLSIPVPRGIRCSLLSENLRGELGK